MIYIVKSGDTVDTIATALSVPVSDIIYNNQITYPYGLAVGQALYITGAQSEGQDNAEQRSVYINGYAYTFINKETLVETLKYLSTLSVFSYGFTTEGTLISPIIDDTWMITLAAEQNVQSILTLTPLDSQGKFNNQLIHSLLINNEARSRLNEELLAILKEKGFSGVDIDFEYILAEDRDMFTDFVAVMTKELNSNGYEVSVALAPKTSADQKGLLYEGKDYAGLGAAANHVLLMTYEWGYTYGPPMAVAPLNMVRKVIEYAITEIPSDKINMGIPNYGYDWPLPFERGVTKATTIGNVEAVNIAVKYGASIMFDETAQAPFFTYTNAGIQHEVWFDDVRSIEQKLKLIEEYNIRGAGYWQIMRLFRANWLQLESMYEVRRDNV